MQQFKLKGEKLMEKLRRRQSSSSPSSPTPGPGQSSLAVPRAGSKASRPTSPTGFGASSSFISASSSFLAPHSDSGRKSKQAQHPDDDQGEPQVRDDARHDQSLAPKPTTQHQHDLPNNRTPASTPDRRNPPQNPLHPPDDQLHSPLSCSSSSQHLFSRASHDLPASPVSAPAEVPTLKTPQQRPTPIRRQSLLPPHQVQLGRQLLVESAQPTALTSPHLDYTPGIESGASMIYDQMVNYRKIWVKRPGGSPTMITINESDLMDDVRDVILAKYRNALGRAYDAPDIVLKVYPANPPKKMSRGHSSHDNLHSTAARGGLEARQLQPDESVTQVLDEYFPTGQTSENALVIELMPARRIPARNSPSYGLATSTQEIHEGIESDYFSIVAGSGPHSSSSQHPPQLTPLPASPDARRITRPVGRRTHTASPTVFQGENTLNGPQRSNKPIILRPRPRNLNSESHTLEASEVPVATPALEGGSISDPSLRLMSVPSKKPKSPIEKSSAVGLPNGAVPPINVLIVEDNIINLRLLEAFMKRLKVRWQSAMNGREAVEKWRSGGFHLVLMDIQLPVMSGLEATKEIRRLESVNGIGVLAGGPGGVAAGLESEVEVKEEDRLNSAELFKSPVIIVALTASSLQSDRNEALAAGCNDFLTKASSPPFL